MTAKRSYVQIRPTVAVVVPHGEALGVVLDGQTPFRRAIREGSVLIVDVEPVRIPPTGGDVQIRPAVAIEIAGRAATALLGGGAP